MTDPEDIRQAIVRTRVTLDGLSRHLEHGDHARVRLELGRQRCEDLIRQLEDLLNRSP